MFIKINKNTPPLTDKGMRTALKRFEWLTGFLICRFKFIHHMLGMTNKIPKEGYNTMGVRARSDGKFDMIYDPVWFNHLTDAEAVYIFNHEMYHIALHHCTRRPLVKIADINRPTAEEMRLKSISNKAHDLAVNELIPIIPGVCDIPRDAKGKIVGQFVSEYMKDEKFKDIKRKQTSEWYFEYLKNKADKNKGKGSGGCEGLGKGKDIDDHSGWSEQEMADARVCSMIKKISDRNMWGDMSFEQKELVLTAQIRKINWRSLIKVWFGNLAWKYTQATRKKPNRRTGLLHPGTRKLYIDRWLVAIDTSASIDAEILSQWIAVLNQLAEELPIDEVQFDTAIVSGPNPYDRRRTKFEFKGRGGTCFQPVIDLCDKRRYKGVMILTDGEAAVPTKPKTAQVLWVLKQGSNPPVDWGKKVHLQKYV